MLKVPDKVKTGEGHEPAYLWGYMMGVHDLLEYGKGEIPAHIIAHAIGILKEIEERIPK